jgi:hypothetical protein
MHSRSFSAGFEDFSSNGNEEEGTIGVEVELKKRAMIKK